MNLFGRKKASASASAPTRSGGGGGGAAEQVRRQIEKNKATLDDLNKR